MWRVDSGSSQFGVSVVFFGCCVRFFVKERWVLDPLNGVKVKTFLEFPVRLQANTDAFFPGLLSRPAFLGVFANSWWEKPRFLIPKWRRQGRAFLGVSGSFVVELGWGFHGLLRLVCKFLVTNPKFLILAVMSFGGISWVSSKNADLLVVSPQNWHEDTILFIQCLILHFKLNRDGVLSIWHHG